MTYEDFVKFVQSKCMHETIYEDSEGRSILVIDLLDAFAMTNKMIEAEREACAKVCEDSVEEAGDELAWQIRARGQA
jgi:hypothetical protein